MTDVKPLVWERWEWDADDVVWEARTPFGWVNVRSSMDGVTWCWITPMQAKNGYQTAADAKAAAEAWWEAAVLKCLTQTEEHR